MGVSSAEPRVRYTESAVRALLNDRAKEFLVEKGLPAEDLLFRAYAESEVRSVRSRDGRDWLCVGELGDSEDLCIDVTTGVVSDLNSLSGDVWHVNASVEHFAASLAIFSASFPFYPADNDGERKEKAAQRLRAELAAIDPTSTGTESSYWETILFDVANGDYADE